jgi:hypothetical protein
MAPYPVVSPVTTTIPLEPPHGVGLGQIVQFGDVTPSITEYTPNNVEFQPNFLPQSPSEQIVEGSEAGSASALFECTYCSKTYTMQYMLSLVFSCQSLMETVSAYQIVRKHENVHTKPRQCHLCHIATAERRDLNRHFWSHHEAYARANRIPEDKSVCPECGKRSRTDNMSRHRRRKHGDQSSR